MAWNAWTQDASKAKEQGNANAPQAGRNMGDMSGGNAQQAAALPIARPRGAPSQAAGTLQQSR